MNLAGLAVCLFTLWNARNLLAVWETAPGASLAWIAATIWLVPVVLDAGRRPRMAFFAAGQGCAMVGTLTGLDVLTYIGLALACAGFVVLTPRGLLWLGSALSWMPLVGSSTLHPVVANAARLLLAFLGTAFFLYRPSDRPHAA